MKTEEIKKIAEEASQSQYIVDQRKMAEWILKATKVVEAAKDYLIKDDPDFETIESKDLYKALKRLEG